MNVPTDTRYELLSDARRRATISALAAETTPIALTDLAREVAAREADDEGDPDSEQIQRLRLSLYHTHAPKLDDAGVVSFDIGTNTIAEGTAFDAVRSLVTAVEGRNNDAVRETTEAPSAETSTEM